MSRFDGSLGVMQLGMGWFPEQAGGLNRYYYDLFANVGAAPLTFSGLVVGNHQRVLESAQASIHAYASLKSSLASRVVRARLATRRVLNEFKPDVVAAHFALYAGPALDLISRYPFVMHFQGPWADESAVEGESEVVCEAKRLLERAVYRRADRVIVLSEAFGQIAHDRYGVAPHKIVVVPGGVDLSRFNGSLTQREARDALGWPNDRPIVLTIRRLVRRMGLENLISAVAEVRKHVPDVLLHIVGRGPLTGELQDQIEASGLSAHIRLLGFVDEDKLPLCYRAATLSVVSAGALEGFGLVTVESLASGTPVLVTPVGGLPEAVAALSNDLVMADSSPASMSEHLTQALTGAIRLPTAAECRRYAEEHFSWPKIIRRVSEVYRAACR